MSFARVVGDRAIPSSLLYEEVRPLLKWVYVWMFFGLIVTTAVAFLTTTSTALLEIRANPIVVFGSFFLQLGLVIGISAAIHKLSPGIAAGLFILYAALNGFVFSVVLLYFSAASVVAAFVTTSLLFGAMTVFGFTTTIDLTKMGSFLMMAVIGLLIAIIVNMFLGSGLLDFVISIVGVIIFTALTAYDTQNIKRMAADPELQGNSAMFAKMSIIGALALYLNFINIFLFLLQLMSGGEE